MTEPLTGVLVQLPVVALFYWMVGKEIATLAKKIDEQAKLFEALMDRHEEHYSAIVRETNGVLRENTGALTALKTMIEAQAGSAADETSSRRRRGGDGH